MQRVWILTVLLGMIQGCVVMGTEPDAGAQAKIRRKVWGHEWQDLFDERKPVVGGLKLAKASTPTEAVDIANHAGKIVVLVEVDPEKPWWDTEIPARQKRKFVRHRPETLDAYRKLFAEYAPKGVVFLPVWTDRSTEAPAERSKRAAAYLREQKLPGELLLDSDGALDRYCDMVYTEKELGALAIFYRISLSPFYCTVTCIRDAEEKIVYRQRATFDYWAMKLMLDRLLDPEFDLAVRREFPQKRSWPKVEQRTGGLAYVDDFEQYEDSYAFKLDPRWGFTYDNQAYMDFRGDIAPGQGRAGSKAAWPNSRAFSNQQVYNEFHVRRVHNHSVPTLTFPAPLKDGYVRFHIRRGPKDDLSAYRVLPQEGYKGNDHGYGITFFSSYLGKMASQWGNDLGEGDERMLHEVFAGRVTVWGKWGEEKFRGMPFGRDGKVAFSDNDWHEVKVICEPDKMARIEVDGVKLGDFRSSTLTTIHFNPNCFLPGFLLDDIEVFYNGDAAAQLAAHGAEPWPREVDFDWPDVRDDKIEMVDIKAGEFTQGADWQGQRVGLYTLSRPKRKVKLNSFLIGKYPVSYGQYRRVWNWALKNGYAFDVKPVANISPDWQHVLFTWGRGYSDLSPNHQVASIRWYDLLMWCNALSEMEGLEPCYYTDARKTEVIRSGAHDIESGCVKWDATGYRLPTVAEWQYACGAGSSKWCWWGDGPIQPAWVDAHLFHPTWKGTPRIGSMPLNPFGIGDIPFFYERCWDISGPYMPDPADNPKGPSFEGGLDARVYIERQTVLMLPNTRRAGGKADNHLSLMINRAELGGGHEQYGNYGNTFKRADQSPDWDPRDSAFRVARSDPRNPNGSYAVGRPAERPYVAPRVNDVKVTEGKDIPGFLPLRSLPGGVFTMGGDRQSPNILAGLCMDETPRREVKLDAFAIGKTEVTFEQFEKVFGWAVKHGYEFHPTEWWRKRLLVSGRNVQAIPQDPVNHVCWSDAVKWCNAASEMQGLTPAYYTDAAKKTVFRKGYDDLSADRVIWHGDGYRLPTEAEWEYAARGGTDTKYFWGNVLNSDYLWYYGNTEPTGCTSTKVYFPVGTRKPNQFGLHDMAGNVFEWCWDWLAPYDPKDTENPSGADRAKCLDVHKALAAQRYEIYGLPHSVMDPDIVEGEFLDNRVDALMKARRRGNHVNRSKPWPEDILKSLRRTRRVQRGGATWGLAKRNGCDPLFPRHDQGFRVVVASPKP
jgi:formylglycine-generating enzyme required for sulfatase activity